MRFFTFVLFAVLIVHGKTIEAPQEALQLLVVPVSDVSATEALLYTYERKTAGSGWKAVFDPIPVSIGYSGLGLGAGEEDFDDHNAYPLKVEGDGRSPAGIFTLSKVFGYAAKSPTKKMPYIQAAKELHCVDDVNAAQYNQLVRSTSGYASHEEMYRDDGLYEWGIVVDYNTKKLPGRGSCIFIHIQAPGEKPTSGCTAMPRKELLRIIKWLDLGKKPVLMQYWSDR